MISYSPFWETLKKRGMTTYTLINKYHISSSTLYRLKKNKGVNTTTLNDFCKLLNCRLEDIAVYIPDEEE